MKNIVARIRKGLPIIVVDDKKRENEGDLFFAASKISVPQMAFMIRYTTGIICAPMTQVRARKLRLSPLMKKPTSRYGCKFTMPVDVHRGTTSGVSAHDRVFTLRRLASLRAKPSDFGRPGHVFPLLAHPKLLKGRQGHTEGAVALLRLAKMPEVGVIGELINDDGTMMRGARLTAFAKKFSTPIVSIEEIYRRSSKQP